MQKVGETLQDFEAEEKRLMQLGHPTVLADVLEEMITQKFI